MFGHAAGWNNDPAVFAGQSHSWHVDKKGALQAPTEHHSGFLRRHSAGLNQQQVRIILFGPATDIDHYSSRLQADDLRELAYTLGGVGGPGTKPLDLQGGLWFRPNHRPWCLAWHKQLSCGKYDFTTPWRILQWQPPLRRRLEWQEAAAPQDLTAAQRILNDLAGRSTEDLFVLDGVIPSALITMVTGLGCSPNTVHECLMRLVATQLEAVVRGTQSLMLRAAALWQTLGSPLRGLGRLSLRLSACANCGRQCHRLFVIRTPDSSTGQTLSDQHIAGHLRRLGLTASKSEAAARCRNLLSAAIRANGLAVCLPCAAPSLGEAQRAQHLTAATTAPAPTSTSRYPSRVIQRPPEPPFGPETPDYDKWVGQGLLAEIRSLSGASSEPPVADSPWPRTARQRAPWVRTDSDLIGRYFRHPSAVRPGYKVGQELIIRHPLVSCPSDTDVVGQSAVIQRISDGDYHLDRRRPSGAQVVIFGTCDMACVQLVHKDTDWVVFDISPAGPQGLTTALVLDTTIRIPKDDPVRKHCRAMPFEEIRQAD